MFALYLKEIRSFLNSIIGYVFIAIFLIANGLFLWFVSYDTNVMESGIADLIPFFNLAPIIFLMLIPAITMRSIAEEKRTGTIELLFTRPLSDWQIVFAKFFAGATLVFISLLPTLIYYVSIHLLGDPVGNIDDGATIGSYIGLFLLGVCFVSVGLFASSITSSQIVAFILAMFSCWFLFDGLDLIGSYNIWGDFDSIIQYSGMKYHYESIMKGVVDTRDLIYFISLSTLFLVGTYTAIKAYKR
ncbi:MAG: gliding motility-associated ABC transporter permease subunit GldF [Crocinitomicaceae bacterium]